MSGNTEDFTSDEVVNGDFKTEAAASKLSFFFSVADPDSIRSEDPDPGGQKSPTKIKIKSNEISCF
jgi:hypothetical protein